MSDQNIGQTYYELLEVPPTAGSSEIYAAYQKARATYSPASPALYTMFTPEEAQELMTLIEEAYKTLSHQARRNEYDSKMGLSKNVPSAATGKTNEANAKKGSIPRLDDPWIGPVKVNRRPNEELPPGFERTKFSIYEKRADMEHEIESMTECDGSFLQKVRLYRGVTLDQMVDYVRVIKATLVALEANDLDALPVAVFTRGFVIQYARALNLNEKQIADAYMKYFKANKVAT